MRFLPLEKLTTEALYARLKVTGMTPVQSAIFHVVGQVGGMGVDKKPLLAA